VTLKVIISGCARGATRWAYESIKRAGHDVGFCSVFNEHSSPHSVHAAVARAPHEIEVSWFSAPFLTHPAISSVRTVHLCRDPLATLNSLCWSGMFHPGRNDLIQDWYNFSKRFVPDIDGWYRGRPSQAAMYYLCEWSRLLNKANYTAHAEKGAEVLLAAAGLENKTGVVYNNSRCNSSGCRRQSTGKSIKHLPISDRFWEMSETQGYVCDENNESTWGEFWCV
jgi:hypothetical protein